MHSLRHLIRENWYETAGDNPGDDERGQREEYHCRLLGRALAAYGTAQGDDGKPLAVVEAKKKTVNPEVGQQQAKLYANCLEERYNQRPIIFYNQRL